MGFDFFFMRVSVIRVILMKNNTVINAMVVGMYERLEGKEKKVSLKTKNEVYWKNILN